MKNMTYNILLIDDCNATTIANQLKRETKFNVSFEKPRSFAEMPTMVKNGNYSLVVIDFRLTNGNNCYDAPALAQALRTPGVISFYDVPIILISSESKITSFYKQMSSCKLFDYSIIKEKYLKNPDYYNCMLLDIIQAYDFIKRHHKLCEILAVPKGIHLPDIVENTFLLPEHSSSLHENAIFVLYQIVKPIGILIGEDVLAARLGVSKDSADWEALKNLLSSYQYNGVFSTMYPRWWAQGVELWWDKNISKTFLRQLTAEERVQAIIQKTGLKKMHAISLPAYAQSCRFWTICQTTLKALDPLEGFELLQSNLYPWQEQEYISFEAILQGSDKYKKYATKEAKQRFRQLEKDAKCKQ